MRAVAVAEEVGGRRGDHRDVDVDLAILNRLPAAAVRAQHAHAAHVACVAVVAQRAVHAAFDVVIDAGLHQIDRRASDEGNDALGEPHQVFRAHPGARSASAISATRSPSRR